MLDTSMLINNRDVGATGGKTFERLNPISGKAASRAAASGIAELIGLVRQGLISGSMAKEVFSEMVSSGRSAAGIVKEKGISQLSDEQELRDIARGIIEGNPNEAEKYRAGRTGLLGFFVGKLMAETEGKANPRLASRILKELLET